MTIASNKAEAATGHDTTAPEITHVTFQNSITKPNVLKVTVTAKEEDTGIKGIDVAFCCNNKIINESVNNFLFPSLFALIYCYYQRCFPSDC